MLLPYPQSRQMHSDKGHQKICKPADLLLRKVEHINFPPLDSTIPVKCDTESSTNCSSSSTSHVVLPRGAPNVGHARRFSKGCASLPGVYITSAGM